MTIPLRGLGNCQLKKSFTFIVQGYIFDKQELSISQESAVLHTKSMHSYSCIAEGCVWETDKRKLRSEDPELETILPECLSIHVKDRSKGSLQKILLTALIFIYFFCFWVSHQLEAKIFFYFCGSMVSLQVTQQLSGAKRLAWQKPRE